MRTPFTFLLLSQVLVLAACDKGYDPEDTDSSSDTDVDSDSDSDSDSEAPADLKLAEIADLGERLVDHEDMTVYLLSRDVPAVEYDEAESVCVGGCADKWAAVPPGDELVGAGLDEAYLGSLTREDGYEQATWKGWPLYTFADDYAPGDALGEGAGGQFFTVPAGGYSVMPRPNGEEPPYLIDAEGMALYRFAKDTKGYGQVDPVSACVEGCREVWPIAEASEISVPSSLDPAEFSSFERPDGGEQLTFRGWPLYRFSGDEAPGDTNGQGKAEGAFQLNDPS